jgi:hypothetical protein
VNQIASQTTDTVSVSDFGATGTGKGDDSRAIQAAVDTVRDGGTLLFPPGIYRVEKEIRVCKRSGIRFLAIDAELSAGLVRLRSLFYCDGCRDLSFAGFRFNQRGAQLPPYVASEHGFTYQCPIYFINGDGLAVTGSGFDDLYSLSVFFFQSSRLDVADCTFACGVSTNDQWLQFIHLQTYGGANTITGCRFQGHATRSPAYNPAAIFASGGNRDSSLTIESNFAEYCGRDNHGSHRLGVFDIYGDAQNVVVRDNVSLNTMAQFMRLSSTRNARVSGNNIVMSADAEFDYSILTIESVITFAPGQVGCQNIEVSGNRFEDSTARAAFAVGILSYDWGAPATAIVVKGNQFLGCRRSVYINGPYSDIAIVNNGGRSGRNSIEVGHNGVDAAHVTAVFGREPEARFDKLVVALNILLNDTDKDANAVTINLNKTPRYSGSVGSLEIRENSFRRIGHIDAGQAIAVVINAATRQGELLISGNETNSYTHDWYIRGTKVVKIEGNRAVNSGGQPYLDDGTNGTVSRRNNRFSVR